MQWRIIFLIMLQFTSVDFTRSRRGHISSNHFAPFFCPNFIPLLLILRFQAMPHQGATVGEVKNVYWSACPFWCNDERRMVR